ncbi:MAG: bifunctional 4-hydroxy-3-methylbut-2-enyl diphosphate reductase/30S ribosomal protein S1 [Bacillota bacterium]
MKVLVAGELGFCYGVRRAVDAALQVAQAGGGHTLGPIVHNDLVVRELANRGVSPVDKVEDCGGSTLVIRAHGVPGTVLEQARELGCRVVDATCPFVRRAQLAAAALASEGRRVVIVGSRDHPEVVGLLSAAGPGAVAVKDCGELAGVDVGERVGVIAQTTQRREVVQEVLEYLVHAGTDVREIDTICSATGERQEAMRRLARASDVVVVVGSAHSANTRRLAEIAREQGRRTYVIDSAGQLEAGWLEGAGTVGIAAGASTPDWITKEVVGKVEEMEKDRHETANEEAREPEEDQGSIYEGSLVELKPGDIVTGKVVSVDDSGVLVDVGYKSEGLIPANELAHRFPGTEEELNPGDEISVYVTAVDGQEGVLRLSKRRADEKRAWDRLETAFAEKATLEARVIQEVKGGLTVDVGLRGFVPASQVERGYVSDLGKYVGRTLRLRVLELDREKSRAILSQRVVLEEEHEKLRAQTWGTIEEGQVRRGVVKGLTDFGAFVDLGGVDGLLHVSELSWGRVKHPSDVLKEGQALDVKVLRVDRDKGRISLGLKQIMDDPWANLTERFPVGGVVKGRVTRLAPFGAFVELEPGVEGLVHISEMADRHVGKPEEVVSPGEEVKAKILRVRPADRRISLSLKEVEQDRERAAVRDFMAGQERETMTIGEVFGDLLEGGRERLNRQDREEEKEGQPE